MDNLQTQIDNLKTLQESYDAVAQAAEAYNTGKVELAANITSKGVPASASETLPELAEKVSAIAQQPIILSPSEVGDMYAVQQFGSLTTPNYWNLYEVLNTLLNDGRLVNYGGILLAEYYKGYDSLALSGAGTGGAYVVSDMENGQFKMYIEDTMHTWATEFNGKGNRWVAYCFSSPGHGFEITDYNTSPRSIFIGRNVGKILSLSNASISKIVVPDGNYLGGFDTVNYTQQWGKHVVIRNINATDCILYGTTNVESVYISGVINTGSKYLLGNTMSVASVILESDTLIAGRIIGKNGGTASLSYLACKAPTININLAGGTESRAPMRTIDLVDVESANITFRCDGAYPTKLTVNILYKTNDKDKSIVLANSYRCGWATTDDVVLKNGWCKPLNVAYCDALTEANMYAHILQRLKQDEPDCGDGVTITLGATNLAKLTSAESVQLLDDLTNIYGYTFA